MATFYKPWELPEELKEAQRKVVSALPPIPQPPTLSETKEAWGKVITETPEYALPFMPKVDLKQLGKAVVGTASALTSQPGTEFAMPVGLYAGPKAKGFATAKGKFSSMADKMERFEISDRPMKTASWLGSYPLTDNPQLGELITHPELFKNYPELNKVRVLFDPDMAKNTASWVPLSDWGYMKIGPYDKDVLPGTILHEIQHGIQDFEGFAGGGSYNTVVKEALDELGNKYPNISGDVLSQKIREKAISLYRRLAGEIESRDVDYRRLFKKEERMHWPPYSSTGYPLNEWVIKKR